MEGSSKLTGVPVFAFDDSNDNDDNDNNDNDDDNKLIYYDI